MNDDQRPQAFSHGHSRKRPHNAIDSVDSSGQHGAGWPHTDQPGSSSTPSSSAQNRQSMPNASVTLPSLRNMRFRRSGFDYRRPVVSTDPPPPPPANAPSMSSPTLHPYFSPAPPQPSRRVSIVDLTQDPDPPVIQQRPTRTPRQPRFGRDIMGDVVDLEAETAAPAQEPAPNPIPPSSSSPEVQFLGTAVRQQPLHPPPPPVPTQTNTRNAHDPFGVMASLTQANLGFENLLRQFTSGTINPYLQGRRPDILHQEIDARTRRHLSRVFTPAGHPVWVDPGSAPGIDLTVDLDEDGPVRLNYTNTATQTPPYTGPSPAPEGFTRTPEETHNAICPNCEHELGTGDDPLRRQIWIAKPCGHVYCGSCTKHRALRGKKQESGKGSAPTKPFSKCVVSGCEKQVSPPKAMFQLYL